MKQEYAIDSSGFLTLKITSVPKAKRIECYKNSDFYCSVFCPAFDASYIHKSASGKVLESSGILLHCCNRFIELEEG